MNGLENASDPFALAARQIALDRAATAHLPALFAHKKGRLGASPHAFLRGSAPLFYETLAARPDLAAGAAGDGYIVGDMHLENVGAYRNDADEVVFDLNDFDDAAVAPLRLDVLRLSVSVLLAARGLGATGDVALGLGAHAVRAYLRAREGGAAPPVPAVVRDLVQKVKDRRQKDLLDARVPADGKGRRRFARGARYLDLPPDVEARVPALLAAYVAALGDRAPVKAATFQIEDAALRIAGNGSLGVLRVALLVRDHGGDERLLELKECRRTATAALVPPPAGRFRHEAERVATAAGALLPSSPRHLAAFEADGRSFVGRRLFPQEDKLALDTMHPGAALDELVQHVGHLLGSAHARGVAALGAPAPGSWTSADVDAVIDHAVTLCALHEGAYLAWLRRIDQG